MIGAKIVLKGLGNNTNDVDKIKLKLRSLLDDAPSDASIKFNLSDRKKLSTLKIYSSQKKFIASLEQENSITETLDDLCENLRDQLATWKSERFKDQVG